MLHGRQIAELEQAIRQGASRKTWKITNDISGKLVPFWVGKVKKLNGEVIKSPQELLNEWWKYFSNLMNVPPVTSQEIRMDGFDDAEIDKAIKGLNNKKDQDMITT